MGAKQPETIEEVVKNGKYELVYAVDLIGEQLIVLVEAE